MSEPKSLKDLHQTNDFGSGPENFSFLILRVLELFTLKVCEMFVYKHTETIE